METPAELFARNTTVSINSLIHRPKQKPFGWLRWSEEFLMESSCDAVPRIADSTKSVWRRLIWALLFLAALGILLSQIVILMQSYFAYPVAVNVEYNFSKSLSFPAVTFCNLNPIRNSKIKGTRFEKLKDREPTNSASRVADLSSIGVVAAKSNTTGNEKEGNSSGNMDFDLGGINYQQSFLYDNFLKALDKAFTASFADEIVVEHKFEELHPTFDELRQMGHQLDDMLLDCMWKGLPCSASDFVTFQNYKYGNCFTFNSGRNQAGDSVPLQSTSKPGPANGLLFDVTLQQEEYIGSLSSKAGVRVLIHSQDVVPFPEEEGIDAAPGSATSIGIKLVTVNRLPYPWDNCTDGSGMESIYDEQYGYHRYSMQACMKSCLAKVVVERCACTSYQFPLPEQLICAKAAANETEANCVEAVYEDYVFDKIKCDCPQSCHNNLYDTTLSAATWPSLNHEALFREKMDKLNRTISKKTGTAFHNNFARIQVYYKEMNYQHISQTKGYPTSRLLADIGGQMGLWLGLSVLSALEFIEFLMLTVHYIRNRKGKENVNRGSAVV